MSARVEGRTPSEPPSNERSVGRLQSRPAGPALDLTCTKVAVDLQSITAATAAERIPAGLPALTDAWGADSVFVVLLDEPPGAFDTIYAGRSTFSACTPEQLKGRPLDELPWLKARL